MTVSKINEDHNTLAKVTSDIFDYSSQNLDKPTATQKKQAKEDAAALAMGYDTMRKLNTALANAYAAGTLDKLIAEMSPENARLRDAAGLAYRRLCDQNGRISQDEWNENYSAMAALREALEEKRE